MRRTRRPVLSTSLSRFSSAIAICAALAGGSQAARAAVNSWNGATDALWNTDANWLLSLKPVSTDDLIFPATVPATGSTITLGTGETALSLTFRNSYTLTGGDLTLGAPGAITVASGSTATINSSLIGAGGLTLAVNNGLADADAQTGGGTLVLGGTNTYSGLTTISAGVLSFSASANLGDASATNGLLLSGGTLRSTGDGVDLGPLRTASVTANSTIDVTGTELILSGAFSSDAAAVLTKTGVGTLTLSGTAANATAGRIQVNAGTLQLNKTGVTAIGAGGVSVSTSSATGPAIVKLLASDQIDTTAPIALSATGGQIAKLDLNGFNQTAGPITMTTNTNGSATISTGATGVLTLNADLVLNNIRGATGNTGREILITGTGTYGTSTSTGTLDLGGVSRTITVNGVNFAAADATIETAIRNGALVKEGSHALLLRGTNTYAGGTTINNGAIVAFNDSSLGTGAIDIASGTTRGELALNNVTFTKDVALSGGSLSGAGGDRGNFAGLITVGANSTVLLRDYATALNTTPTARDLTISGELAGIGNLSIQAPGAAVLRLTHDNSSYTGQITVEPNASLAISNSNALGTTSAATIIQNGASLRLSGNISVAEPISLAGTGPDGAGALRNIGGVNVLAAPLTLTGDAIIQADSGSLQFANATPLSGNGLNVTVQGAGEVTFDNAINLAGGTFVKAGPGTLTFTSNLTALPVTSFVGGTLGFTGPQSFGAQTIPDGLAFRFNSDPGAGVAITAPAGTRVLAGYAADQALLSRLAPGSAGTLALRVDSSNALDFTAYPEMSLGAAGTNIVVYDGQLTPGATGYHLGGGAGRLLVNSTLTGNNPVTIQGDVRLGGQNTFTGGITVEAGAQLAILDNTNLGAAANVLTLNGGTLQVNEVSGSPTSLFLQLGNALNPVGAGTARTIFVSSNGGRVDVPAPSSTANGFALTGVDALQGAAGSTLVKSELGIMYMLNSNSFAGDLTIAPNGNVVELRSSGALPNVGTITLNTGSFLNVDNQNILGSRQYPNVSNNDRVNDAATINLLGGRLQYIGRNASLNGASTSEVFGIINVGLGQSEIRSDRAGTAGADLVISDLARTYGGTARFTAGGSNPGGSGDNGRIRVLGVNGDATEPATGTFLGGWATYNTTDFATYIKSANGASGGVVRYGFSGAPAYATAFGTGNVANITGSPTLDPGNTSVLALRFGDASTQSILFSAAADTLYVESGGIMTNGVNSSRALGSSTIRGNVTAGAIGATTPQELFLHNNSNRLTVYANVIDNPGGGTVRVVKDLDSAVTLDSGGNTYSGGTYVLRGTLDVSRVGGLGSGEVVVKNSALNLGSSNTASGANVAADAPVFRAIDNATITLTSSSTTSTGAYNAAGDRYSIAAGSTIYANSQSADHGLNSLTRVEAFTGGGQIQLAPGAIVQHNMTDAPNQGADDLTIKNLGTAADLYFSPGSGGGNNSTLTIGAGTPWAGLSTDRSDRRWNAGTIFANSDIYLQGLTRDNATVRLLLGGTGTGTYSIVNTSGKAIDAFVQGTVALEENSTVTLPNDLTFVVMPGALLQPNQHDQLGSGANVAQVLVQAGGTLDPGGYVSLVTSGANFGLQSSPLASPLNGKVTVRAGGRFLLNDGSGIGSAPVGSYLLKKDSVLELGSSGAFRGSGDVPLGGTNNSGFIMPGQFVYEPGAIVRFTTDSIQGVSQFVLGEPNGGSLVYELFGGSRTLTAQVNPLIQPAIGVSAYAPENFTIGAGGVLTNDSNDRQVNGGFGGTLVLGDGAALAATTQTILTVQATTEVLPGATVKIGTPGSVDGNYALGAVNFNGSNALIMGAGAKLQMLNGTTLEFGNTNVFPDTADLDLPFAVTTAAPNNSNLIPGSGTSLWLGSNSVETISKLTGVGRIHTNQSSPTLQVGYGLAAGDDFTFGGEFSNAGLDSSGNPRNPNLSKIGESTLFLTGGAEENTSAGLMSVYQGRITLAGEGAVSFATSVLGKGGTLVLDNSGTAKENRLSGKNIAAAGGDFILIGSATTPVTENAGTLAVTQFPGGLSHLNVNPAPTVDAPPTILALDTIQNNNQDSRASYVFRGAGMAGLPGTYDAAGVYTPDPASPANGLITAQNPNLVSNLQINQGANLVTYAIGTPSVATRPDILGSLDPNSQWGDRLMTQDVRGGGFRLLADSEYAHTIVPNLTNSALNVKLDAGTTLTLTGDSRTMSLTMQAGSELRVQGQIPTLNSPSRLYFYAPAIIAEAGGTSTISGQGTYIDRGNSMPWYFHTFGDLTINSGVIGSNGFVKNGDGTLTFGPGAFNLDPAGTNGAYGGTFWGGTETINGGRVVFNDSVTFLRGQNSFSAPHLVLNGGVLDLNGHSQVYNRLDSASPLPNTGGTVTSAAPAVLSSYAGGLFSGHITGALSYAKFGNTTETFTSAQTYTGATSIRNGTLALTNEGTLSNTSALDLNFATLRLDNSDLAYVESRVPSNITINSLGGTFDFRGRTRVAANQDLATAPGTAYNLLGGNNTIRLDAGGQGSASITIGNLTRTHFATTLTLSSGYGGWGDPGPNLQDLHLKFALNGAEPAMTNGILGGWAVVGSSFAVYDPVQGIGEVGNSAGGFGTTVGSNPTTWDETSNVAFSGSPSASLGVVSANSIRMTDNGTNPTVTFASGGSLTLTTGGLITTQNRSVNIGSTAGQGTITSGAEALYFWINGSSTTTINSHLTDNGANSVGLVKFGGANLSLNTSNSYTGGTYVNQGTLTLNVSGANGATTVAVPGDLFLNGGNVSESVAKSIASTAHLSLNGGSSLTLKGGTNETFASITLRADGGGSSTNTPIVTASTATNTAVTLTEANAITVLGNAIAVTPTLSVNLGTVNFAGPDDAPAIIHVEGDANNPMGLVFNPNIGAIPTAGLVKTGNLELALGGTGANQFGVGATDPDTNVLTVEEGILRIDNAASLGNNHAITTMLGGTALLGRNVSSTTAGITGSIILNDGSTLSTTEGSATFGAATTDPAAQSFLRINGDVTFFATDYFLPVTQTTAMIINSKLTGSGNLNLVGPAGPAAVSTVQLGNNLTGSAAGANDFSGTITVNRNVVLLSQATANATSGSNLGAVDLILNGGELRLRDNGAGSNSALDYGNNISLLQASTINADRISANSNNRYAFGRLTVGDGIIDLGFSGGNGYSISFAEIAGPGTLRKESTGNVYIESYAPGFSGDFRISGPQGIAVARAQGLNFNAPVNDIRSLVVAGNYLPLTGKTVNISDTLTIAANTGVVNGLNGVSIGSNGGAISIPNGAILTAGSVINDGIIGTTGTGGAELTAATFSGNGFYQTFGQPLTLHGNIVNPNGVIRIAGGTAAGDIVTFDATAPATGQGIEVQSGSLRITGSDTSVLGNNLKVLGYPATAPGPNSNAVAAPGGALVLDSGFDTGITHTGDLEASGTVRASGTGITEVTGIIHGSEVTYMPGLLEGRISTGSLDTSANRPGNPGNFGIKLEPRMAQTNLVTENALTGWQSNTMWVYTGQFHDADGLFSFAESIDDRVLIVVDGVNVLINNSSSQASSTAYSVGQTDNSSNQANANSGTPTVDFGMGPNGDGWHTIEIRIVNGTGGAGPSVRNGFSANFGLGLNTEGAAALDGSQYQRPIDSGDGSLFRTPVGGKGSIVVDPGSYLKAAGFNQIANVTINGGSTIESTLQLTGSGQSDADKVTVVNLGFIDLASTQRLITQALTLGAFGELYQEGGGTMEVNGQGGVELSSTALLAVEHGKLVVNGTSSGADSPLAQVYVDNPGSTLILNGSLAGDVNVGQSASGALVGGSGSFGRLLVSDGTLAPGNPLVGHGIGTLTTGELTLNSSAVLDLQIGATGMDRIAVNGQVNLDGEIRLTLEPGYLPTNGDVFTFILNDDVDAVSYFGSGFLNAGMDSNYSSVYPTIFDNAGNPWLLSFSGDGGGFDVAGGNDVALMSVIPEPSSAVTALLGASLFGGFSRLRRRRA